MEIKTLIDWVLTENIDLSSNMVRVDEIKEIYKEIMDTFDTYIVGVQWSQKEWEEYWTNKFNELSQSKPAMVDDGLSRSTLSIVKTKLPSDSRKESSQSTKGGKDV